MNLKFIIIFLFTSSSLFCQNLIELKNYSDPYHYYRQYDKYSDETTYPGGDYNIQSVFNIFDNEIFARWGNFIRVYKDGEFLNSVYIHSDIPFHEDRVINGPKYLRFFRNDSIFFINKNDIRTKNLIILSKCQRFKNYTTYRNKSHSKIYPKEFSSINYFDECIKHELTPDSQNIDHFEIYELFKNIGESWLHISGKENLELLYIIKKDTLSDKEILRLTRNKIFAGYGRTFKTTWINDYFTNQPWYNRDRQYSDELLTKYDIEEINFIKSLESK